MTTDIQKSDLEAKLREIEGVVLEVEEESRTRRRLIIAGGAAVVIGLVAFSIWRYQHDKIRVEVYRL
ncbi:MAG: hypothetical protein ACR2N2_10875 [Acidimicrobiia bacterium]